MHAGMALGNIASFVGVEQEESSIVAELKAGSEEAFAWLIAKYHQPIYSVIARMIPDTSDAADLTQDVFLKVYRGIGNFHGSSSLQTWIYRIALREASNQRRWWCRHRRREVTIESEIGNSSDGPALCIRDTLVDHEESPFEHAVQAEVRQHVEEALRRVPEPYRSAIILRDIEGFSYEEVAEILDVNMGTVKSRIMRGRAHLKSLLTEFAQTSKRSMRSIRTQCFANAEEAQ